MAVDRGGLQYTISIRDQFSKTTAKFRSEIGATKAAFADFQKGAAQQRDSAASFKKTAGAIDEQQAAMKRLAAVARQQREVERTALATNRAAQADVAKFTREKARAARQEALDSAAAQKAEQKAIKERVDAQNRNAKQAQQLNAARIKDERAALTQQQRDVKAFADNKARTEREASKISTALKRDEQAQLKSFADAQASTEREAQKIAAAAAKETRAKQQSDPNFLAQKRINDSLKEEAVVRAQIGQLRQRAVAQFASGDLLGGAKSLNQAKDLKSTIGQVNSSASQLFFTFRRLVGILAIFTIAREAVQGFQDLVRTALAFNNTIEQARIGIAGLIVASTEVRDQFGQTLTGADAFAGAIQAARDQVKALTADAVRLGVPFQTLVETFQIAVAPGFGAGLNLNQIRSLTGSISAAAKAIGLQQNQLAEEIRSILSGTIQARTTRIATALGITNADVRRLKETGQLFDFLQNKFKSFNIAAEKAARSTLSGVTEVVQGVLQQILGKAAGPLFNTLIQLGNEFLDKVLTIRDAEGNLQLNPEVVKSFQIIFDAIRDGVLAIREAFSELGFDGLQSIFEAAGAALVSSIQFAIGFAETLFKVLTEVVGVIREIAGAIGIGEKGLGRVAGIFGSIIALTVAWDHTIGLTGLKISTIGSALSSIFLKLTGIDLASKGVAASLGLWTAIIAAALAGFDLLLSSLFDVNLTLLETSKLIGLGLIGGLESFILKFKEGILQIKGALSLKTQEEINVDKEKAREASKQRQLDIDKQIAEITTKAAERGARGPGFDPLAKTKESAKAFTGFISGARNQIKELDALIKNIDDDIFKTGKEFSAAFNSPQLQGPSSKIQDIFSENSVTLAVNLKKIRGEQSVVEKQIADIIKGQNVTAARRQQLESAASGNLDERQLKALKISESEGQLISLFQDEREITEALTGIQQKSVDLAIKKAAIVSLEASRDLEREAIVLNQQAAAEQRISDVVVGRLGARRQAVVEAENALLLAQTESKQRQDDLQKQIDAQQKLFLLTNRTGEGGPTAAERQAIGQLLTDLQARLAIEQQIAAAKEAQLEAQRQEAALIESGSIGQGFERGFEQLSKELPTAFEAGVAIVKQSTTQLADFISSSIVQAFDPTVDQSLQERFARFLQSIAQIILQQIIQLAIASAIQQALGQASAGATQVAAATTAAAITTTAATTAAAETVAAAQAAAAIQAAAGGFFSEGGLVPRGYAVGGVVGRAQRAAASLAHMSAPGLAIGGLPRPAHVPASDTQPAWLTPGEFVVRKSVVDRMGLGFFNKVNAGGFTAPPAAPSGAQAGEAAGMARGGLVTDRLERRAAAGSQDQGGGVVVLPTLVAGEKELDRLHAGGKNSFLRMIRENSTTIRGIVNGGK